MNANNNRRPFARHSRVVGASVAGLAMLAVSGGMPAHAAADEDVDVVNTETVQVYMDANGAVDSQRVYEQLTLTGKGSVDIANPIEESGLRNLDGFSGFDVEDGLQQVSVDVDGVERLRSVSDYDGDLPLQVSVEYRLDGERIDPDNLVGADGVLEVEYTVRNVTSSPQEITYPDGKGGTITETADVPIPMVGSLSTVAPANFTEVTSGQANMAGDGKGGTRLSFTMTLFPPLGSDEVSFGYTANVTDGVVPGASISALPVNPLESPTFKTAGDSYKSGSDTGVRLADGATEIDSNLLRLRDGAGELLAGLIQLSDGADQLNAGLAGEAAPGATRLASGALRLDDGLGQIDDGAGKLADGAQKLRVGAGQLDAGAGELAAGGHKLKKGAGKLRDGAGALSDGTGSAVTGSEKLESGLGQISGGLATLADANKGLPSAAAGVDTLKAGVDQIIAGFGAADRPETLLFGLNGLEAGLSQLEVGAGKLGAGLTTLRDSALIPSKSGVDQVQAGLNEAVKAGGSLDQLIGALTTLSALPDCATDCKGMLLAPNIGIVDQVKGSKVKLSEGNAGLLKVSGGLSQAIAGMNGVPGDPNNVGLISGAQQLAAGLALAKTGATQTKAGAIKLRDGATQVSGGLTQLKTGLTAAVAGVLQLNTGAGTAYDGAGALNDGLVAIDDGAGQLAAGAGELAKGTGKLSTGADKLADGTGQLRAGSSELAAGAGQLADGTGKAKDGSGQLADGAGQLADGLGDAADGSGRLADGLQRAADGAPALEDGARRLSAEGMSKLIAAGKDTAQSYGKLYAVIGAGAERADAEKMAYGAPENARGLTAYSYELVGDDGEGGRNTTRGLAALALLGAGLGALGMRRRKA